MFGRANFPLLGQRKSPQRFLPAAFRVRTFTELTAQGTYPLHSRTPCGLAYIKECSCWQLQKYIHLNPKDPHGYHVKGSLDPVIGDGILLKDDFYHFGEVGVSQDGLIHPESACKLSPSLSTLSSTKNNSSRRSRFRQSSQ